MNRLFYILISLLMLCSCIKAPDVVSQQDQVQQNYAEVFVSTFGEPSQSQDWGFGTRVLSIAGTRSAQPNGNQWGTHDDNDKYLNFPHPDPITEDELQAVLEVFNQKGEEHYTSLIDWSDYFVQQVYTGPNGDKMTELAAVVDYTVATNVICWWPYEAETVVTKVDPFDDIYNNFNNGTCTAWDGCMLMFNSATKDFSWKTVQSGGPRYYGHWRMEKINGNYYVGFDNEAIRNAEANDNEEDTRDYIYNDWIVKLVPGLGYSDGQEYRARIICEDLTVSQRSDFDFNDVVFDVVYREGDDDMIIIIQAAGGTLPLYVAGHEVHELFAEANPDKDIIIPGTHREGTMINTNSPNGISGLQAVSFQLGGLLNPIDIPVVVCKNGDQLIPLKANPGEPAAKIAVDPDFQWCDEREDILKRYPAFSDYVKNGEGKWF